MRQLSRTLLVVSCWFACWVALAQPSPDPRVKQASRRQAPSFEQNAGQADPRYRFLTRDTGRTAYLRSDGYTLVVAAPSRSQIRSAGSIRDGLETTPERQADVITATLVGADPSAQCAGERPLDTRSHYLVGRDPSGWTTDVPHYERVVCEGVYGGIDAAYHGRTDGLEFDFILAPHADPAQIRLAFEGVEGLDLNPEGDLLLHAVGGLVRRQKPTIYQAVAGEIVKVAGDYLLQGDGEVSFRVADYDQTEALVIDPVINWATFLGGSADDFGEAVAVDSDGNVYVAGRTSSIDFPAGRGLEDDCQGGPVDAYVAKLSPDGTQLIFATYVERFRALMRRA